MKPAFQKSSKVDKPTDKAEKARKVVDVPLVLGFEISVGCGVCGKTIIPKNATLLQFTFCGCDNKARICLQNRKEMAHLIGAQDEDKTFVYLQTRTATNPIKLPGMTLRQWNTFQHKFKTTGVLVPTTEGTKEEKNKPVFMPKVGACLS